MSLYTNNEMCALAFLTNYKGYPLHRLDNVLPPGIKNSLKLHPWLGLNKAVKNMEVRLQSEQIEQMEAIWAVFDADFLFAIQDGKGNFILSCGTYEKGIGLLYYNDHEFSINKAKNLIDAQATICGYLAKREGLRVVTYSKHEKYRDVKFQRTNEIAFSEEVLIDLLNNE